MVKTAGSLQILIVEDVDSMRELMGHALETVPGFVVSGLVANGWGARIELSRRRPDVVLLDEVLPGENSRDLLNEFHEQGIPVIFLTSLERSEHPVPAPALGRLIKPGWNTLKKDRERLRREILALLDKEPL